MVVNSGYESNDGLYNALPFTHFQSGPAFTVNSTVFHTGLWSARVQGNSTGPIASKQIVTLSQPSARQFKFGGYSKAEGVFGFIPEYYSIYVDATYVDGESLFRQYAPFATGTHDWELSETVVCPRKPIQLLQIYTMVGQHTGVAFFDDIYLQQRSAVNTSAAFSTCVLSSTALVAGAVGEFNVQVRDIENQPIPCGGDSVTGVMTGPATVPVVVTDLVNGNYNGKFNATMVGTYTLQVLVEGVQIPGALYTITVGHGM